MENINKKNYYYNPDKDGPAVWVVSCGTVFSHVFYTFKDVMKFLNKMGYWQSWSIVLVKVGDVDNRIVYNFYTDEEGNLYDALANENV